MRRKINNQHEARRCLKAAERAGLTAGEWAREHGIVLPPRRTDRQYPRAVKIKMSNYDRKRPTKIAN